MATCSMDCSKQHKVQTACSGERDKVAFVPLADFNDQQLMSGVCLFFFRLLGKEKNIPLKGLPSLLSCSDFGFLQEIDRLADVSVRSNTTTATTTTGEVKTKISGKNRLLVKRASERCVGLTFMAKGLSRNHENRTHFNKK